MLSNTEDCCCCCWRCCIAYWHCCCWRLLSVKPSNTAIACTEFQQQQTEIAFTRLPRSGQDMPHNYACPGEGASFLPLFLLCWLLRQRRKQQLCVSTHVQKRTRTLSCLILTILKFPTWPPALIALITWWANLSSRLITVPHVCRCVNNMNVVGADWNFFKVSRLACATPSVGPGGRAHMLEQTKKPPTSKETNCKSLCKCMISISRAEGGAGSERELSDKPHICTRLIDKGLGCENWQQPRTTCK